MSKIFRVKRVGIDRDNIFWMLGKIHGLENIAYCDPKEIIACKGNPVLLQNLINKVEDVPRFNSHEEKVAAMEQALINYQAAVEKMNLQPSDKKKMLALPFYMVKRSETPAPKRGQVEWEGRPGS